MTSARNNVILSKQAHAPSNHTCSLVTFLHLWRHKKTHRAARCIAFKLAFLCSNTTGTPWHLILLRPTGPPCQAEGCQPSTDLPTPRPGRRPRKVSALPRSEIQMSKIQRSRTRRRDIQASKQKHKTELGDKNYQKLEVRRDIDIDITHGL